jgi:hypothetical protein
VSNAQKVILVLIGGLLAISSISWFVGPDAKDFVRFLLECVLCWYLWKGANWARWVVSVLAAVACVMLAVSALRAPVQGAAAAVVIAIALFNGFAAYVLLSRKWVAAHFRTEPSSEAVQRIAREDANTPEGKL